MGSGRVSYRAGNKGEGVCCTPHMLEVRLGTSPHGRREWTEGSGGRHFIILVDSATRCGTTTCLDWAHLRPLSRGL